MQNERGPLPLRTGQALHSIPVCWKEVVNLLASGGACVAVMAAMSRRLVLELG